MACVGARMLIPFQNCLPICNESGGSCQAGSQTAYVVAEILADGANIDAIYVIPALNDVAEMAGEFAVGSQASWLAWKANVTAMLNDLRGAITTAGSSTEIVWDAIGSKPKLVPGTPDQYWTYFTPQNMINLLIDPPFNSPSSNYAGVVADALDHVRAAVSAVNGVLVDFPAGRFLTYLRWSEQTYNATNPADCSTTQCVGGHLNNFGHKIAGDAAWLAYLIKKGSVDTDGDKLPDAYESYIGTNPAAADTDGDTCPDGVEVRQYEHFGGNRDPLNAYDFFDTNGDQVIDGKDIGAMRSRVYQGKPTRKFAANFRREPPSQWTWGLPPDDKDDWDTKQATSGDVSIKDLALLSLQRTHRCDCVPPTYTNCLLNNGARCVDDMQCKSNVCGCGGGSAAYRTCQPPTATVGFAADPRRCTGLGEFERCIENADCASNVCSDKVIKGRFQCVGNTP
jgi:hypothetical protein